MTVAGDQVPVITLDGPGGAGKGTIATALARHLGWHMLDSGALYRLAGLIASGYGLDADNTADHERAADLAQRMQVVFTPGPDGRQQVWLDAEDVSEAIRRPDVADAASRWAVIAALRRALLARQRDMARAPGLIADGRDMGTVVFPTASLKLFVTASAEARAERRAAQLSQPGATANITAIYDDIIARDTRDRQRSTAPLTSADDAVLIDTTGENEAESIGRVVNLVADRGWCKRV